MFTLVTVLILAMKKQLLLAFLSFLCFAPLVRAQTTGTYIVTDNPAHVSSCSDTLITLADIFSKTGIRDLNDPTDDISMYKMFRLAGSVITEEELTSVRYSDYPAVFIKKMNATDIAHSGVQIFLHMITPPTSLFTADTLKYTVEKGATVNYSLDFFSKFIFYGNGNDATDLSQRILFTDETNGPGTENPISANWTVAGKGKYKIRVQVAVCTVQDYYYDSIYIIINETPCLKLEIKNMPAACRQEVIDITPYVYLDGNIAGAADLANMTFTNKSLISGPGVLFDPADLDMTDMIDKTTRFPQIQIAYQPNVELGVCTTYTYVPALKVPAKITVTDLVSTKNNYDQQALHIIDGDYYSFNNQLSKDIFKKLYLDNFNVHAGTVFSFYSDAAFTSPVTDAYLSPGPYYIVATNPACSDDSTRFTIQVKERDFDIFWKSAPAIGKGYYTFTAPVYSGATYEWFVWGGSIISGINTNEVTVYYSEDAAPSVLVSCSITLSAARTTGSAASMKSAVYITSDENGDKEEITPDIATAIISGTPKSSLTAYPNPAAETFSLSGTGIYDVKIYNTLGQLVFANASYEAKSPITLENKGMHVIYVTQKGIAQVVKVIVE